MEEGRPQRCYGARVSTARARALRSLLKASLTMAVAVGCSSEEQPVGRVGTGNNHPPAVTSASILPTPVVLSNPLAVRVDAHDLDGQNVAFRYRWLINGHVAEGHTDATLPPQILKRGDQVAVEVTPHDGIAQGAVFRTAAMPVVNTPPVIQHASIEIDQSAGGRQLSVKAEIFDPDRDSVTVTYRWLINAVIVQEGESNTFEPAGITTKDMIQVEIVASDGASDGASTKAAQFKVGNSAPTIVTSPPSAGGGGRYAYLVQATDPDGDPVTYALETAPPGMSIDAATGQVRWIVPPDAKGSHRVRVVARDDRGGMAAQEFDLALAPPPAPPDQQSDKS